MLSALNPLQYIPVVGTLYRAATGDTIPEGTRMAGGMVVSVLMGGPVGLVTNIATTMFEKVTGFDPDRIGRRVLANLLPDRRLRVSPRVVKRAISKFQARGPNINRHSYKATLDINILAVPGP